MAKTQRKPSPVLMYWSLIALYSSWPAVSRMSSRQVSPSITTCFLYESCKKEPQRELQGPLMAPASQNKNVECGRICTEIPDDRVNQQRDIREMGCRAKCLASHHMATKESLCLLKHRGQECKHTKRTLSGQRQAWWEREEESGHRGEKSTGIPLALQSISVKTFYK